MLTRTLNRHCNITESKHTAWPTNAHCTDTDFIHYRKSSLISRIYLPCRRDRLQVTSFQRSLKSASITCLRPRPERHGQHGSIAARAEGGEETATYGLATPSRLHVSHRRSFWVAQGLGLSVLSSAVSSATRYFMPRTDFTFTPFQIGIIPQMKLSTKARELNGRNKFKTKLWVLHNYEVAMQNEHSQHVYLRALSVAS